MGSTYIGDGGQCCGAGAGGNGTATGGATGATWEWGLLVLQGLLVVVEGERKMWVDHNIHTVNHYHQGAC
jgi:hypothetical protein